MRFQTHEYVPAARVDGLVVTESKNEVLVYDTTQHHIHHLNQMSAEVWRLCDGRRSVSDLVREVQLKVDGTVTQEGVRLALTKLEGANLLDAPLDAGMRGSGHTRRALLKRAAVAGAVAVPTIVSITAPTAAQTASQCTGGSRPNGCDCKNDNQCASGRCNQNGLCRPAT